MTLAAREALQDAFVLPVAESAIDGLEARLREYVQRLFPNRAHEVKVTTMGHSLGGYKAQVIRAGELLDCMGRLAYR